MGRAREAWRTMKGRTFPAVCALLLFLGIAATLPASDIDFSKGVRIGSGPKTVVEFTDPDCPFCRSASRYLDGRSDVTRYVFFFPLARHPRAREKARYILSQSDRARTYHEVMAGKLDRVKTFSATESGVRLQQEQSEIASRAGVRSTPTFMVFGRVIVGFDEQKLREALGR